MYKPKILKAFKNNNCTQFFKLIFKLRFLNHFKSDMNKFQKYIIYVLSLDEANQELFTCWIKKI